MSTLAQVNFSSGWFNLKDAYVNSTEFVVRLPQFGFNSNQISRSRVKLIDFHVTDLIANYQNNASVVVGTETVTLDSPNGFNSERPTGGNDLCTLVLDFNGSGATPPRSHGDYDLLQTYGLQDDLYRGEMRFTLYHSILNRIMTSEEVDESAKMYFKLALFLQINN